MAHLSPNMSQDKKSDWLGTSGPKEQHSGTYPGFSFYFIYSRCGTEEVNNLEMPSGIDKAPTETCSL